MSPRQPPDAVSPHGFGDSPESDRRAAAPAPAPVDVAEVEGRPTPATAGQDAIVVAYLRALAPLLASV